MSYKVRFEQKALKSLSKLESSQRIILLAWISRNLENCENPRFQGKVLVGKIKQYWRYRVGNYRIVVDIYDDELIVVNISFEHRREIYKKF